MSRKDREPDSGIKTDESDEVAGGNPEEVFPTSAAADEREPPGTGNSDALDADDAAVEGDAAAQRDEYLAMLQRVKAEFDNYRKRVERERSAMIDRASERVVLELLPVLDACQAAVAQEDEGVTVVYGKLMEVLGKEGLEATDPLGEPFDPNLHEAVLREDEGAAPETVLEVMRGGYSYRGRVLRPAMVKVQA